MSEKRSSRAIALLRLVPVAVAGFFLVAYLSVACLRMRYPFELEWMEGAMADVVMRVVQGQKLYVVPTARYVPFIYPPLYFYVAAGSWALVGPGLFALRLVSFLASLGVLFLIYSFVRRETGDKAAALLAAGFFSACFQFAAGWFDLARIDSLFLALVLGCFYVLRFAPGRGGYIFAAGLLTLSFLTKQLALLVAAPMLLYLLVVKRRLGVVFLVSSLGFAVAAALALDLLHDGWFVYFLFKVPSRHSIYWDRVGNFWLRDLGPLAISAIAGAGYLLAEAAGVTRDNPEHRSGGLFYSCMAAGMLLGSMFARLHRGGAQNALIPACAALAVTLGLAAHAGWKRCSGWAGVRRGACEAGLAAVLLCQFCLLRYDFRAQLPTNRDRAAGEQLVASLASRPGEVLIPYHGYLAAMAGKPPHAHQMAITDLYIADWRYWHMVNEEFDSNLRNRRYGAVVLDSSGWHGETLARYYKRGVSLFDTDVFWPVTGMRTRPEREFIPQSLDSPVK